MRTLKSCLCGTLTKIILVWLFDLMKFLICLRAVLELFLATSLAPPQKITTSFFIKFLIPLFAMFTRIPAPALGFSNP